MSHCCLSFDLRLLIISFVSSSFSCQGTFCTTTIVRKKRGKITSLLVMTSRPATVTDVTSGHISSGHVTSGDVISVDVTSGSTPFLNYDGLQVLKTVKY
jgi:hypothetical protein